MRKRNRIKRIAVVDSIHCGSLYGLHPPDFQTSAAASVPMNPGQAYLWDCWKEFWRIAHSEPLDAVVVLGDVIDGKQRKQQGGELNLALIEEQVQAARMCLEPYVKDTKLYIIQGTEYHDGTAAHGVEELGTLLKATTYSGLGTGYRSKETLDLNVDGTVINFAHHGPMVAGLYRATGADKEGIFSALAGKEGKGIKADVLVRGHLHFFVHVEHESKHIVYVPCFQLQTRFMRHSSVYRMIPDIGGIIIQVDEERKNRHMDAVTIVKVLFRLPPMKAVNL